jgi:hypothetical protein
MYEVGGAGFQLRQGIKKKYIPYKFPTSLSRWRERWFYIGNHQPSLPGRTVGALRICGEWTMPCRDMSQIEDMLRMIKKHRDAGVTRVSVMYTWLRRWIQPLQKRTCFGFEYLGVLDPSHFSAEYIEKGEALLRVSRVLMGAETVPYVSSLYTAKNPPKQVGISSRIILSSTSGVLCYNLVLTYLEIRLQDDINVYQSMPPMPDIERLSHLEMQG